MTNDEIETRIARLEVRLTATQALIHALLPATDPAQGHQVLKQFGQWCAGAERDLRKQGATAMEMNWQLGELATMYTTLEGALKLVADWRTKQKNSAADA